MEAYVNNQQDKKSIDPSLTAVLEDAIKFVLHKEGINNYEIGVTLVDDDYILKLNSQYRGKDVPTDVLSFPLSDEDDVNGDTFVVGDVVISVEAAERQAYEYGHSFEREMVYLLVHGIYHILGYTHDNDKNKEAMRQKEEEIMNKYNLSR
ncbi:rRNA maturation RNase YbeY [Desulfitibacter alkalitolerans]|uniref:rRNA maturation RNase YbeY n=1 Tax=Desulfitibacter alkalitolerans TaxID=264641 RepID=UPI000482DAF5|nr:rRNA maturation RNase YbeY [Desulfitibacter alkalitolerans]